jgi:hypothetical protein
LGILQIPINTILKVGPGQKMSGSGTLLTRPNRTPVSGSLLTTSHKKFRIRIPGVKSTGSRLRNTDLILISPVIRSIVLTNFKTPVKVCTLVPVVIRPIYLQNQYQKKVPVKVQVSDKQKHRNLPVSPFG